MILLKLSQLASDLNSRFTDGNCLFAESVWLGDAMAFYLESKQPESRLGRRTRHRCLPAKCIQLQWENVRIGGRTLFGLRCSASSAWLLLPNHVAWGHGERSGYSFATQRYGYTPAVQRSTAVEIGRIQERK
jgi:hypothetical protein